MPERSEICENSRLARPQPPALRTGLQVGERPGGRTPTEGAIEVIFADRRQRLLDVAVALADEAAALGAVLDVGAGNASDVGRAVLATRLNVCPPDYQR